jgi:hypothetical protein
MPPVKYWEIIADRLHAEGWCYGIAEHFTKHGLLFCVDAYRGNGKRFIVKAEPCKMRRLLPFLRCERSDNVLETRITPQSVPIGKQL